MNSNAFRLENLLTTLIPLLLIWGTDMTHYVLMLPLIMMILQLGLVFIKMIWKKHRSIDGMKCVEYTNRHSDGRMNDTYNKIMWYLETEVINNADKLRCTHTATIKYSDQGNAFDKKMPVYELGTSHKPIEFILKKNKFKIIIRDESNEQNNKIIKTRIISIYSDKIKNIKDFVDMACEKYLEFIKGNQKNINEYYMFSTQDQWKSRKIKIYKTRENIFINDKISKNIYSQIQTFIDSRKFYKKNGIPYKRGFVFYGPPGCGKTSTVYAIARDFKKNIYDIKLSEISNNTELRSAIEEIPSNNILVIEDIDVITTTHHRYKKTSVKSNENDREIKKDKISLDALLEILDGYNFLHNTIIIFTTNHIEKIDPALIRPGRIDDRYEFGPCDLNIIQQIFTYYFQDEFDLDNLEMMTVDGLTQAELINTIIIPNHSSYKKCIDLVSSFTP